MRRLKILLAEDDDDLRSLYGYMLLTAGYKVNAVRNGLEAFAEIQVNRPDVVVTDITMPILRGLDLIVAVRSDDGLADLPVVAITSFGEGICKLARAAGLDWRGVGEMAGRRAFIHSSHSSCCSVPRSGSRWDYRRPWHGACRMVLVAQFRERTSV